MATERKATQAAAPKKATAKAAPARVAATTPAMDAVETVNQLQKRRTVVGTCVSDKMQKTIVVKVDRRVRHGLYGKYLVRSRRFKAHDETNNAKIGDRVVLVESRPLSRDKRWVLQSILRRAAQSAEANV